MVISEEEIREIYPRLKRFARSKVQDSHVADDVVQDAILMAIDYFKRKNTTPDHWESWLIKRVKRNCLNFFTAREREQQRSGLAKFDSAAFDGEVTARPRDTNTKQDEDEIVDSNSHPPSPDFLQTKKKCWEELSHREKELLNYSYGTRSLVPLERLEKAFDISRKTLANTLSSAKVKLIKCIKGHR